MQHNSLSISLLLQKLDGKEYDFVFEIEIEEGKKAKLGVNKNDNPYMLASNFIDDHDLNPDYLETIVGWLDEQMDKVGAKGWVAEGSRPLALPALCPVPRLPAPLASFVSVSLHASAQVLRPASPADMVMRGTYRQDVCPTFAAGI
jgi:hypothetical protein